MYVTVSSRSLHPISVSKFADQAFDTEEAPTTYDRTKFQPMVKAQSSPIVT